MSSRSQVTLTVGVSGSGKTYYRCAVFLMDEWLPNHEGKLVSNYPINLEAVCRDWPGAEDRIEILPEDVLKAWRDGRSGPWDYFDGRDISGYHIAIDEIHNYCGKNTDVKVRRKWQQFVGELRHQGATIEFLTQAESKCAKELLDEAEIRYEIQNGENRRVPLLGYRYGDLYEFRAKLIGKYLCPSYCIEKLQADGSWHEMENHIFYRLPKYFEYYDSFNAPMSGKGQGNKTELRPFEKYSWLGLFAWFYWTYRFRISFQALVISLFCWFFFFGGMVNLMQAWFKGFENIGKKVAFTDKGQKNDSSVSSSAASSVSSSASSSPGIQNVQGVTIIKKPNRLGVEFSCEDYVRIDGIEYKIGDRLYNGVITSIMPLEGVLFVDGLICVPFSWLSNDY